MERCETGIVELDQILRGGFPRGSLVLLAGGSGSGKTTLALEFLARGAKKGEPGLLVTVTQPAPALSLQAAQYSFMEPGLVASGAVRIVASDDLLALAATRNQPGASRDEALRLAKAIASRVRDTKTQRLAIDSLTAIGFQLGDATAVREFLAELGRGLLNTSCTTLLVSLTPPREQRYSVFGLEEFIADGVVFLGELDRNNDLIRTLQVIKMRGTEHSRAKFMMDISGSGIGLAPLLRKFND